MSEAGALIVLLFIIFVLWIATIIKERRTQKRIRETEAKERLIKWRKEDADRKARRKRYKQHLHPTILPPTPKIMSERYTKDRHCFPYLTAQQWYYTVYLQSDWWKQRRAEYYKTHKQECALCPVSYGLHLHHRHYANLWCERDEDLNYLCGLHHSRIAHGIGG